MRFRISTGALTNRQWALKTGRKISLNTRKKND